MRGKLSFRCSRTKLPRSFNEARALCAGSFGGQTTETTLTHRFNEARALCAGSSRKSSPRRKNEVASMRPAHYAREVLGATDEAIRHINASMRPAHYAREVLPPVFPGLPRRSASMRPAHYAREVGVGGTIELDLASLQ